MTPLRLKHSLSLREHLVVIFLPSASRCDKWIAITGVRRTLRGQSELSLTWNSSIVLIGARLVGSLFPVAIHRRHTWAHRHTACQRRHSHRRVEMVENSDTSPRGLLLSARHYLILRRGDEDGWLAGRGRDHADARGATPSKHFSPRRSPRAPQR